MVISTSGLSKDYGSGRGCEDVTLTVDRGEVFGFLGPNGAGKTTTIRLLLDLIRPSAGRAEIFGMDAHRQSLEVRRRTGYLPGELSLPGAPTARHYLGHLSRLRGGAGATAIESLADRFGLELERQISDLSKGNKQKVGLVAALMHDPDLLILDEPTSGLDPLRQHDVLELIRERVGRGRTVFLSSHALDQVEHVASRVGMIRQGRLVAVETVSALRQRALREVEIRFEGEDAPEGLDRVAGVRDLVADGDTATMKFEGSIDPLIKELAGHRVRTLTAERPDLDEIFLSYYGDDDGR